MIRDEPKKFWWCSITGPHNLKGTKIGVILSRIKPAKAYLQVCLTESGLCHHPAPSACHPTRDHMVQEIVCMY